MAKPFRRCYPAPKAAPIAGYILVILGVLLLFLCIPGWCWLALIGVALMAVGLLVLRGSHGGR